MKITLIKTDGSTFKIADDIDYERAKKIKMDEEYQCDIKQPRNYKFLRKFFAILNTTFQNQDVFINIDHMREELTKAAGEYDTYINHKGATCYKAKSISFGEMTQETFDNFYERFKDQVMNIFGFDPEDEKL